jgi:hypothetical protein
MSCIICGSGTRFFFAKRFDVHGLGEVEYWRCDHCGFTLSKTHAEMSQADWERLNREHHAAYQGTGIDAGDPRWLTRLESQAEVLKGAAARGLIRPGRWLDYACGDGKLSDLLRERGGPELAKYDRYMRQPGYLDEAALAPRSFDFVVTTSVFEHLTRREQFDAIEALVAGDGVLGLHTLVCEEVPQDPSWFYLAPVHCAFHTNRSMEILFRQWGYTASVYSVPARLWLWLRREPGNVEGYEFKRGFVDYWKVDPRRR